LAFPQASRPREPVSPDRDAGEVRKLVEAGVLPRARLEQAEQAERDKRDEDILKRVLYGAIPVEELSEQQAGEMVAAARRRLDRRVAELEHAKALVAQGAIPRTELTQYLVEADQSRKILDLAESRARLLAELVEMVRAELTVEAAPPEAPQPELPVAEKSEGDGVFHNGLFKRIVLAFEKKFARPLPVSARGATVIHRMLGYDHRGRVDVGLNPDQEEGVWLREFLEALRVPYFAFRSAIPGKSTAPHIHIGPPSARLRPAD